jgi:hypothetical protein
MTKRELIKMVENMPDIEMSSLVYKGQPTLFLTLQDFVGFDEDWNEIYRDFEDEDGIDALWEKLESECERMERNFYTYFYFPGFCVQWGYTSMDI